jgi:hypothetical protein
MEHTWESGFQLDRLWHLMRGERPTDKKPDLLALARLLAAERVAYALIGGMALQLHQEEPRTTVDIDLAVATREAIPAAALVAAGFVKTGDFEHSQNWKGPDGTPVQFSDDPRLAVAIERAEPVDIEGIAVQVARPAELLKAKLLAVADPARRRSKRAQDWADALALVERYPELEPTLDDGERALLRGPVAG